MQAFIKDYGHMIVAATRAVNITGPQDIIRFQAVCAFLGDNPELLSWRGQNRPDPCTQEGMQVLARKFFSSRNTRLRLSEPTTVPDEAVSIVLQAVYNYTPAQTDQIKREHQHSMSAENIVGALLERYISSVLEPHGWVWCAGDFVKAVDFIKFIPETSIWKSVQVKNRDNTENSSSAAIRHGTEIEKWFRTFSRTGLDNWAAFPEPEFCDRLSEEGFRTFIRNYLQSA